MVNIRRALYKKNKGVGLRLKGSIKMCICANKRAYFTPGTQNPWVFTVLGILPGVSGGGGCGTEQEMAFQSSRETDTP